MIMAENDAVLPPSAADGMEKLVPDLEKYLVRDSGHWTQQEKPDEVSAKLIEWRRKDLAEKQKLGHRHCEERSDEAIHSSFCGAMDCFASLAMTIRGRDQETISDGVPQQIKSDTASAEEACCRQHAVAGSERAGAASGAADQGAGPIFWLDMMGAPLVIVSGHDLIDELSDEKRFDKAVRGSLRRVRAVGGDGLFTADTNEPNWSKAHNILLQPFGNRAMTSYHPSMVDIAEQLVKKWERLNGDEEIDVVHDMTALTLDTIGLCGFDYRFNSFYRRDYHPFVESLVRSLETIMMTRGIPLEGLWLQKRRRDLAQDVAFMNKMVDEIIAERRGDADAAEGKKDMLGAMMTGVDRATGEQLDDVNIRYQINTFLIAGHETTSGLLSCTIYALLKHPEVLKKAYEEVDRVLGPDISAKPTYQQVTQLTYITQILKEALRLWPPAPAYGIAPLNDETIGGKYKLKKNTFVTVLVMALHRDPSVWGPNPDAFDPENFSREAEAKRPVNAWKPFGNGQRACIGRGFAMHEAALAIGMILQRFKLIDTHRYQMHLKETLTIKPDGFKIKVRPRADKDRGAFAGRAAVAAAASNAAAPQARTRPGHSTPLLVLYGSNLGTAEELATRVADLAEVNGFATKLGALDDYVGKLPEQGALLIFCASYNGAAPDNATQFVKWLDSGLPKDALAKVRYAVFGCGNSDWAATYQSVPRMIDEQLAAHGARSLYARGEGDARSDLDGQFEKWFAAAAPTAMRELGVDSSFARSADDAPLYSIEPVAPSAVNAIVALGGVAPMKVLVNSELQNRSGANASDRSTRHIEVQLPPGITYRVGDHLSVVPRNDPALVDSVARRFGFLPADQIRLQVAEGRRAQLPVGDAVSVGRLLTEFVELQQIATRKQIQIMTEHTRCPVTKPKLLAYVGDDEASTERLSFGRSCQAQIGVRSAGGTSGLRTAVPRLPGNAVAAGAALLFDLVVAVRRSGALQRYRRRRGSARKFGPRRLQGGLLELSRRSPCRRHHSCDGARDQGRLPPA